MSRIPALPFERSEQDRVVAGVCGGIAQALGVDATLVRLVFAFLALAGGAGILLYLALWVWTSGRRPVVGVALVALSAMAILFALGLPGDGRARHRADRGRDRPARPARCLAAARRVVHDPGRRADDGGRRRDARRARLVARLRRAGRARGSAAARPPPVDVAGRLASAASGSGWPSGPRSPPASTTPCSRRSR